jgi:hypothetical protein
MFFREEKSMKQRVFAAVLAILINLTWSGSSSAVPLAESLAHQVSYHLEHESVGQGEPVLVDVDLENLTSSPTEIGLGGDGNGNIDIKLVKPDGERVARRPIDGRNRLVFSGKVHLEPGGTYREVIVLNEWVDFDQIGSYVVEMGLKSSPSLMVRLDVKVSAKDISVLELRCSELLSRITGEASAQESIASAKALSFIDDPIVVPYWEKLLDRSDFGDNAVSALARVGNNAAAKALISKMDIADQQIRESIRRALRTLSDRTNDESLKTSIDEALKK